MVFSCHNGTIFYVYSKIFINCTIFAESVTHFSGREDNLYSKIFHYNFLTMNPCFWKTAFGKTAWLYGYSYFIILNTGWSIDSNFPDQKSSKFVRFGLKSTKNHQFSSVFWHFPDESGLEIQYKDWDVSGSIPGTDLWLWIGREASKSPQYKPKLGWYTKDVLAFTGLRLTFGLIYTYKNGHTDVCLFVCLLVCGELMEIQTPTPILMKFSTHIPTCPRKVLVRVRPPLPHPWAWWLETLTAEGHIFKMLSRLQINGGSAGFVS